MNRPKSQPRGRSRPGLFAPSRLSRLPLWAVLLVPLVCGCAAFGRGPHPRNPEYSDGFYNATGQELTGVHITWVADGVPYRVGAGILGPGGTGKVSHFAPDPIPPRVTVWWRTADGEEHSRELEVASRVPDLKTFTGTIWFKFTAEAAGGVEVVPMSEDDKLERIRQKRNIVPD
jgi:hypothetical protein